MKAIFRPPKPNSKQAKDHRRHIKADLDNYIDARDTTATDRICAFACLTLANEFGFGEKRLRRFLLALSEEAQTQDRDYRDTEDGLLFLNLEHIGLGNLAEKIRDDLQAEKDAIKGSIFDVSENE